MQYALSSNGNDTFLDGILRETKSDNPYNVSDALIALAAVTSPDKARVSSALEPLIERWAEDFNVSYEIITLWNLIALDPSTLTPLENSKYYTIREMVKATKKNGEES